MMTSEDIRECNRLERNAARLDKVIDLLGKVYRENNVSDLDIGLMTDKAKHARDEIAAMRKRLMRD
jgi:hypothetical protein